ncbi:MAG: hypothetical protein F7B19_06665 [Desulfurococcales archaeon]|nr:hypothetical protein [Desulfurococcales archaeon]
MLFPLTLQRFQKFQDEFYYYCVSPRFSLINRFDPGTAGTVVFKPSISCGEFSTLLSIVLTQNSIVHYSTSWNPILNTLSALYTNWGIYREEK